jgi:Zn-dependent oligopeptidase
VLSADAFSLFDERCVFDAATGRARLGNILEKGGSRDAMDIYVGFRGRAPTTDALLRHSGIRVPVPTGQNQRDSARVWIPGQADEVKPP